MRSHRSFRTPPAVPKHSSQRMQLLIIVAMIALSSVAGLAQDTLRIVRPNGGEIFYTNRDTSLSVVWSGIADTTAVRLEISSNNGRSWSLLADSARGLSFDVRIADLPLAAGYRVRVLQIRPPEQADNIVYRQHRGPVVDAVWAPQDGAVASLGTSGRIWGPTTDTTQHNLPGLGAGMNIEWSSDSTRIAVVTEDSLLRIYGSDGVLLDTLRFPALVLEARFHPSSPLVAVATDDNRLRVVDLGTRQVTASFNHPQRINRLRFSFDGQQIATACDDGNVRVVSPAGGLPRLLRGHDLSGVTDIKFSHNGRLLASVGGDASVRIFDVQTTQSLARFSDALEGVRCIAWSPLDTMLAIGLSDKSFALFDVRTATTISVSREPHTRTIRDIDFSPDGTMLATASDDGFAIVTNLSDGSRRLLQHQSRVNRCVWSSDGTRLLTASNDGTARIWRLSEIILQSDESDATFSISPPPPASLVLRSTGGTVVIGDTIEMRLLLEQPRNLALADIDSIAIAFSLNWTVLDVVNTQGLTAGARQGNRQVFVLQTQALPTAEAILGSVRFRATLGSDTLAAVQFDTVRLIGPGPGAALSTVAEPITITGQCRAVDGTRLYLPTGQAQLIARLDAGTLGGTLTIGEAGVHTIRAFETDGRALGACTVDGDVPGSVIPWNLPASAPAVYVRVDTPTAGFTMFVVRQ